MPKAQWYKKRERGDSQLPLQEDFFEDSDDKKNVTVPGHWLKNSSEEQAPMGDYEEEDDMGYRPGAGFNADDDDETPALEKTTRCANLQSHFAAADYAAKEVVDLCRSYANYVSKTIRK